jgi:predicted cation transporter
VIATAVILAEVLIVLPLTRQDKINIAVIACFAIGLGAGLTPIGEPLSTIMVYKLSGPPYNADFFFPLRNMGLYIIPGIILIAVYGGLHLGRRITSIRSQSLPYNEKIRTIIERAFKVYIFIFALILLGDGLKPLFTLFLSHIPAWALYWINIISSFLDNATLTAIEINPDLSLCQIVSAVMALLISGGMLIPGNIPNIVAAGRLQITMKEWAVAAVPVGLAIMLAYFLALLPILFC